MKTVKIVLLAICVVLGLSLRAQESWPTKGKDFWLGFMKNHEVMTGESLGLFIVSDQNTSGTVTVPGQSWTYNFNVTAGGLTSVTIPNNVAEVMSNQGMEFRGVHVETLDTVAVFAINFNPYSADATKVLPTPTLGTEYMVASYAGFTPWDSELLIVATEDDTEIEIVPSVVTAGGNSAGVPFTIYLEQGQCYQLAAGAGLDLTGTLVRGTEASGSCRPFAVFSGASCANVPTTCSTCDHLYEQNLPVEAWGTEYYITPYAYTVNPNWGVSDPTYTYRVLAKENNTAIIIDGGTSFILNAGEYEEFNGQETAHCLTSSNPVTVIQYMEGVSCGGNGDPAMTILDDASQKINDITFSTVNSTVITAHYLNVVVETDNIGSVYLDGNPIAANQFHSFPNCSSHMYAAFSLTAGTHHLSAPDGVSGYVYGNGDAESYGYSVGSFRSSPPITFEGVECTNGAVTVTMPSGYFDPTWYNYQDMETPVATGSQLILNAPVSSAIYVAVANENQSGCAQEFYYSVEDVTPPVFTLTPPSESICQHESVQLNVTPANSTGTYNYLWSPNTNISDATIANPIVSPMVTTTYSVTVSTPTGCASSTQQTTITVSAGNITAFELTADDNFICEGETVDLHASTETVIWTDNFDPSISLGDWDDINNGMANMTCGAVSGTALYFNGTGERSAISNALDVSAGGTIYFSLKIANGVAPCDNAEPGDNVELRFSTDGVNFPATNTIQVFNESAYPDFVNLAIPIPAAAQTTSTKFKWMQVGAWVGNQDNWVIDEVYIATNTQGDFEYAWSPSSTLALADVLNPIASPSVSTNYILDITDNSSGCVYTDSVNVNVGVLFDLDVTPDTDICDGLAVTLQAEPSVVGDYTYEWGPDDGSLSGLYLPNPVANPAQNTTYNVVVTSAEGCQETASIQVNRSPIVSVSIAYDDLPICGNEPVSLTAAGMGTGDGFTFDWQSAEPIVGSGVSATATPSETTTVTLEMTHDASGCVYTDDVEIEVLSTPQVTVIPTSIQGCSVIGETISASTDFVGNVQWSWSPANMVADPALAQTSLILDESNTLIVTATNDAGCAGSATVTVSMLTENTDLGPDIHLCEGETTILDTGWPNDHSVLWDHGPTTAAVEITAEGIYHVVVTSPDGCISEDTIEVSYHVMPAVDLGEDQLACESEIVTLSAGDLGLTYVWSTGQFTPSINVNESGIYEVTVSNGYCSATDDISVLFNPLPENPFATDEIPFCFTLSPFIAKLDAKNEGSTYEWEDGSSGQIYNATSPGIYYVRVTTDLGCDARFRQVIYEECPGELWVPNAFTPDGDGINDVWLVEGVKLASYHLILWNKWGELIYETYSLDRPWLGQRRDGDEYVEPGTYVYRIIYKFDEGDGKVSEEKQANGQVTLVR
ncbi:MAG: gliding motility-associated C-terminal domain-containing protein [Flavobacteriales bacterium]